MRRSPIGRYYAHLVRVVNGLITHDYATRIRARAISFVTSLVVRISPARCAIIFRPMDVGTLKRPI